uniref:Uncharacterized protein n=1 Tax=viral metagenome TaxID=1070528 RepID=A0A6C0CQ98_9ZZZZ
MDFYDTSFICTYKKSDDDISDDLYRSQFLQAFKLKTFDDNLITEKTDKLFHIMEKHLTKVFTHMKEGNTKFSHMLLFMGEHLNNANLFRVFFVYDVFDIFHRCICDVNDNNKVSDKHYSLFKNAVLKNNTQ